MTTDSPERLGPYELVREIGRGAMGVVHEVIHGATGDRFALKLLRGDLGDEGDHLSRFSREIAAVRRLNHPSLLGVRDAGESDRGPWFVMDLVDGPNLQDLIFERLQGRGDSHRGLRRILGRSDLGAVATRGGSGALERALCLLFAEVAEGLQSAHAVGLVHRDIKPSNLLLTRSGRLRLGDFGLVRDEGRETLTRTGEVVGTPLYMAPEQVAGERVGPPADIYALAASLYESITLRPPHDKSSLPALVRAHERDEIVPPSRLRAGLPISLDRVLLKALDRDPHRRYGDAGEFAADLRRIAAGEAPRARSPGPGVRFVRSARKEPLKAAVAAMLAVLLVDRGIELWRVIGAEDQARTRRIEELLRDTRDFLHRGDLVLAWEGRRRALRAGLRGEERRRLDRELGARVEELLPSAAAEGDVVGFWRLQAWARELADARPIEIGRARELLEAAMGRAMASFQFRKARDIATALARLAPEKTPSLEPLSGAYAELERLGAAASHDEPRRRREAYRELSDPDRFVRLPYRETLDLISDRMSREADPEAARLLVALPRRLNLREPFPPLVSLARRHPDLVDEVLLSLAQAPCREAEPLLLEALSDSQPDERRARALVALPGSLTPPLAAAVGRIAEGAGGGDLAWLASRRAGAPEALLARAITGDRAGRRWFLDALLRRSGVRFPWRDLVPLTRSGDVFSELAALALASPPTSRNDTAWERWSSRAASASRPPRIRALALWLAGRATARQRVYGEGFEAAVLAASRATEAVVREAAAFALGEHARLGPASQARPCLRRLLEMAGGDESEAVRAECYRALAGLDSWGFAGYFGKRLVVELAGAAGLMRRFLGVTPPSLSPLAALLDELHLEAARPRPGGDAAALSLLEVLGEFTSVGRAGPTLRASIVSAIRGGLNRSGRSLALTVQLMRTLARWGLPANGAMNSPPRGVTGDQVLLWAGILAGSGAAASARAILETATPMTAEGYLGRARARTSLGDEEAALDDLARAGCLGLESLWVVALDPVLRALDASRRRGRIPMLSRFAPLTPEPARR